MTHTAPNYKTNDPKGWQGDPKRGAALGRHSVRVAKPEYSGTILLSRVRLNAGGYDQNGTYFGHGEPIYWYANAEGTIDGTCRAEDRECARAHVLRAYPHAKIRK